MSRPATSDQPAALSGLLAAFDGIESWQREIYLDLHRHPELGHQEHRTGELIVRELREMGLEVVDNIGVTGSVGILRNGDGPTILMRADIDGLPIKEETGLEYASTHTGPDREGNQHPTMHACGHDAHVSMLLGATRLLAQNRDGWSGTFLALFQPSEETGTGAQAMVDDNITTRIPRPDVAFGQHVAAREAGTYGLCSGPALSAADSIRVMVYGRGGHGSRPHTTVDPVVLAASIVMRLQTIVSRELDPTKFAVLTVGKMHAGTATNVIADHARLDLNLRTYDPEVRQQILAAIDRIVSAECEAAGSPREPEITLYDQFPLTVNDPDTVEEVRTAMEWLVGEGNVVDVPRSTGSEDFSVVPTAFGVPYCFWTVGSMDPATVKRNEDGAIVSLPPAMHTAGYAPVIDPTLRSGTEVMVAVAMKWLGK